MKLQDTVTGREYSLPALHAEWLYLRAEDPWNHSIDFPTELLEILMATISGRNDLDIIGMTPKETGRYLYTLRKKLNGGN